MLGTDGLRLLGRTLLVITLAGSWAIPACNPAELTNPPNGGTAAGGALPYDAGNPDANPDAQGGHGPGLDAGATAVLLGLSANPAGAGGGTPSEADMLEARLTTYAVGVRSVLVSRSWASLDAEGIDSLAAEVATLRSRGLAVVLNLLVVDRMTDHRPAAVAGLGWSSPQTIAALQTIVDEVLATLADDLHALVFSRETDVYLTEHPDEASQLVDLMDAVILHAEAFADGETRSGVGLSYVGTSPSAAYGQLLDLGQLAVWSYQPGLGAATVPNDTSAAKDLDTMMELAGTKPIVLVAAGAPTGDSLGATEEAQQQFFASLFGALTARRSHFDVVSVHELHDRNSAACAELAQSRGEPVDGAYAQYVCSCGLKDADGVAKPAWLSFVEGAAAFASP